MGNYSFLRALRNFPNQCIIDWDSMNPMNLPYYRLKDLQALPPSERPKTLEDMANHWNETKFFGYLDSDYIQSLNEFCRGLVPYGCNPRLFYEHEGMDQICCIEFIPGTGIVNISVFDFHRILASLPSYSNLSSELREEWTTIYNSLESFLIKYCIDTHPWKFQHLE
jgi:hypothetical protein